MGQGSVWSGWKVQSGFGVNPDPLFCVCQGKGSYYLSKTGSMESQWVMNGDLTQWEWRAPELVSVSCPHHSGWRLSVEDRAFLGSVGISG